MHFVLGAVLFFSSCDRDSVRERVAPSEFRLSLSRGGGVTGAVRGCDFVPNGRVRAWKKWASGRVESLWTRALPPLVVEQRVAALASLAPVDEPGNFSYRVVLERPDTIRVWTWAAHDPLTEWYRNTRALCRQALADSTINGEK